MVRTSKNTAPVVRMCKANWAFEDLWSGSAGIVATTWHARRRHAPNKPNRTEQQQSSSEIEAYSNVNPCISMRESKSSGAKLMWRGNIILERKLRMTGRHEAARAAISNVLAVPRQARAAIRRAVAAGCLFQHFAAPKQTRATVSRAQNIPYYSGNKF